MNERMNHTTYTEQQNKTKIWIKIYRHVQMKQEDEQQDEIKRKKYDAMEKQHHSRES